ncbi:hypothetical protein FMEXI_2234 [Fusarium mexicanum]|uniref:Uncharacterized protein n=1 Tax=Fusarium mexicanum TaxID=751941 RepID=A0A8H5JEC2_9HYPO|nr:hypothetical protein FMEXI_2234 [Fusarium mexicanum]
MMAPEAPKYFADQCTAFIPVEELDERIKHAKRLETTIREWELRPEFRFRAEHVVAILTVPLPDLQPGGSLSGDRRRLHTKEALDFIAPFFCGPSASRLSIGTTERCGHKQLVYGRQEPRYGYG